MKLKGSPYWAAALLLILGAACLAAGLAVPAGTCTPQDIGPAVCTDPAAPWTWAGDALIALAVITFAVTAVRRRARRQRGA